MIPVNDLKAQYESIRSDVDSAVREVLERSSFILGPLLEKFEQEFAAYCGVGHGVGVASGTEAIQLAILASGVKPGDEIITVANTAVATVAAIRLANGIPKFVDVNPQTYTLDPANLEEAITPRTRAIIPVHLYGQCADMEPIIKIAKKHGLWIIEDCAQAHGALYHGRHAGSMGDFGCFSFYPTKNLGAYGDGGMVIVQDPKAAQRLRLLRNYGQTERFVHTAEGMNSRLDEVQASILSVKLKHLDPWNTRRRHLAKLYTEKLKNTPLTLPIEAAYAYHVYHLYVVQTPRRGEFQRYLFAKGIETSVHYPIPIYCQKAYRAFSPPRTLPVTELQMSQIVTLPLFPELEGHQIEWVTATICEWVATHVH